MKHEYYNVDLAHMKIQPLGKHESYASADLALEKLPYVKMQFDWIANKDEIRELMASCAGVLK